MKYFTPPQTISQSLPPLLGTIYLKAIENINHSPKKQELLKRKYIKTLVYKGYTLDSISNALNQLHDLGLMFFNKVTQAWDLIIGLLVCHNEPDYDNYIKFKQDWPNFIPLHEWRKQQE